MSFSDIKDILHEFHNDLMDVKTLNEIIPFVDGLTDFDKQQILATTRNEGYRSGNKKLLILLERKSGRSLSSYISQLKYHNPALPDKIIHCMYFRFRSMYRFYRHYENERKVPSAVVKPIVRTASNHPVICQQIYQNVQTTRGEQELEETPSIPSSQSISRSAEVRRASFTEDTLLEDIPNATYLKWAEELNRQDGWKKIGDLLHLTRNQIIRICDTDDPGTAMLDFVCSVENITVNGFINLLESIQLTNLIDIVKESLGHPTAALEREFELEEEIDSRLYESANSRELFGDGSYRVSTPTLPLNIGMPGEIERNRPYSREKKPTDIFISNQSKEKDETNYRRANVTFNNLNQSESKRYDEKIINTPPLNKSGAQQQNINISNDLSMNRERSKDGTSFGATAIKQPVLSCEEKYSSCYQGPLVSNNTGIRRQPSRQSFPATQIDMEEVKKQCDWNINAKSRHLDININLRSFHDLHNSLPFPNYPN